MRVLSLFDGISCGRVALERAGVAVSEYIASEIEKSAIEVSKSNWPDIRQIGDVKSVDFSSIGDVDLLIAGSPCQGFSKAGKMGNFDDPRSGLFWRFVDAKNTVNPTYFLLENVIMKKEWRDIISSALGVEPVEICSSLFSGQRRRRSYWTNIPIMPIVDRRIKVMDVIDTDDESENTDGFHKYFLPRMEFQTRKQYVTIVNDNEKAQTLLRRDRGAWKGNLVRNKNGTYRFISVKESCRLQNLPDNYCRAVKDNKACEALGNGWTVDVIAHIFGGIKESI